jgi:hypothetical protein
MMIGTSFVAFDAARAGSLDPTTIASTLACTSSSARKGSCSRSDSADDIQW